MATKSFPWWSSSRAAATLPLVVGVQLAGGALDHPDVQPGQAGDAEAQGHGGDDGAGFVVLVPEGSPGPRRRLRPRTRRRWRELPLGPAGLIDGVVVQHLVGQLHQVFEDGGIVVARGRQGADDLPQMVVGAKGRSR